MPNPEPSTPRTDRLNLPGFLQTGLLNVINHLLANDPQASHRLLAHAGKTLVLSAAALDMPWVIGADGLLQVNTASAPAEQPPDLHIILDAQSLREAIAKRVPLSLSGTRVTGDVELAQALSWLMAHVRWDAEDDLARWIGDIPARRFARSGKAALAQGRQLWERMGDDARDWFAQSPRDLISRHEMTATQDAVRDLRDAAARLDKRLALLRQQLGSAFPAPPDLPLERQPPQGGQGSLGRSGVSSRD